MSKPDPLKQWLEIVWERPERSYNPNVRDFLAEVFGYPKSRVITEDAAGPGFADLQLLTPDNKAWVVGDLKKDDFRVTSEYERLKLWDEKKKYVSGLTRYVLFLTPHFLWIVKPNGAPVLNCELPIDLRLLGIDELTQRLAFIVYDAASHEKQWDLLISGTLPYAYLDLTQEGTQHQLERDLKESFEELNAAAEKAIARYRDQFQDYKSRRASVDETFVTDPGTLRRAVNRLEMAYEGPRHLFDEVIPSFEEQYGREVQSKNDFDRLKRIVEAFVADSVAALVARVLFLRLVEDLKLTRKRRLTNGGPSNWARFVEQLTGDGQALVRTASEDVARLYKDPFEKTVFDWIHLTDGAVDEALQRLILRFNAYDFAALSEEILGHIYQQFLPPAKRKRLGEFYTPPSIAKWLLDETVHKHGGGRTLDPACGSGSFLVSEVHSRLKIAEEHGFDRGAAVDEVLEEIYGFDLNPFAAFITRFQIMWALLRYVPSKRDLPIRVYNLNSLLQDSDIATYLGEEHLPPGSVPRDCEKWRHVVGNPPYIRAERVKYGQEMQKRWSAVWGQNADTGLVFLYRAINHWLEPNGWLGMVVSGGYANSEAATAVWNHLQPNPGGRAALRKLVWLEFSNKVWDPNVIPMLLIIENVSPLPDDEIEIATPETWPTNSAGTRVRYGDFFDSRVNPGTGSHGSYLLPLLQAADVPILVRLFPRPTGPKTVKDVVAKRLSKGKASYWTYGIQRGRALTTDSERGDDSVRVFGGRDIAVASVGMSEKWVDLDDVRRQAFGKLSLWADSGNSPDLFLAVSEIGLAPAAVVVRQKLAAINSVVVALPQQGGPAPEAVAAYLNSNLARFYWAVRLRTGVLEGSSRSHMYPRTLEALPWPREMNSAAELSLVQGYNELEEIGRRAKDNPDDWLLTHILELPQSQCIKLTDAKSGLEFGMWLDFDISDLDVIDTTLQAGLSSFTVADENLAELVFKILVASVHGQLTQKDVQKLVVPREWKAIMDRYRVRSASFASVQRDFGSASARINRIVYEAFALSKAEQEHVESRLSAFPLNRLVPRYPWTVVKARPFAAYTEDRFS